jgi:hypothetical protein
MAVLYRTFRLRQLTFFVVIYTIFPFTVHSWSSKTRCDSPRPKIQNDASRRRQFLSQLVVGLLAVTSAPAISDAGEIGARITSAVTTSDLGISVRRSVVRGAQVMDSLDLQAERISDKLGLGSERSKRPGRPEPKVIPNPKPLDASFAAQFLNISDQIFCAVTKIRPGDLQTQIQRVTDTVRPSFERSGLSLPPNVLQTGSQFNFASYVHFKAYSDIIIDRNVDFRQFKTVFEDRVGQQLTVLLLPDGKSAENKSSTPEERRNSLTTVIERIDRLTTVLVDKGLIARVDLAPLDPDDVDDWSQGFADLSWSVALDGDITLQSQILLQEQGFRLYPNYARYAIQSVLQQLDGQAITAEDYYLDTDYNSDPDMFEVKEVLINISIETIL